MQRFPYTFRRVRRRRPRGPRREHRSRTGFGVYVLGATLVVAIVVAALLTSLATVGATTTASVYHNFSEQLPTVTGLSGREVFQTTRILDRDGNLLYELFDQDEGKRTIVRLSDMPPVLVQAVLAVEDASFYDNPGVDARSIARAAWQNLRAGEIRSGASTITQQLIRNVLLDPSERSDESVNRKVKEAILAVELSRNFSKDQILEWYLNEINYGNLSYGIGTAAKTYFNKSTKDLTLAEVALLAGLPQSPARYDPYQNFSAAKRRQEDVLDLMAYHHFISIEAAEAAKAEPIEIVSPEVTSPAIRYPHWVFYVRSILEEMYGAKGLFSAGLTVYTTLDPHLQDMAEDAVRRHVDVLRAQDATNAALVAIEPWSGEILAMVGSPDYYNASIAGQVNAAVVERQPGSSIKPIVYLSAFLKGYTPGTVVQDEPLSLPDGSGRLWRPQNFDNRFRGAVTLRQALGNSLNIPAVKVLQYAGLTDTINLAKRLGMTSLGDPSRYGLAFTLGGGEVRLVELATAYTVLANGGVQVPVSPITKIVDSNGRVVFEHKASRQQLVDPRVVFMVNDILSDNNARTSTFGANSVLRLANNRPAAAKTGSTDDYRDSWTVGYTPSLVTGVWVGRADNRPMRLVLGSSGAGRIWNTFMERALEGWPFEAFDPPPGLLYEGICAAPAADGGCARTIREWYLQERAPSTLAKLAPRAVAVDRVTGRLADRDTPYADVVFRTFRFTGGAAGSLPPATYAERADGPAKPWEVLPATLVATILPTTTPTPGPSPTPTFGPSPTATPTSTPSPTRTPRPTPTITLTPEPTPTDVPLPSAAIISSPRPGEQLTGAVPILGSASIPDFVAYRMEYQVADLVGRSASVRDASSLRPVMNNQLDLWDVSALPNGAYVIRLTVISVSGLSSQTSVIAVVNNPPPTATRTPVPVPTQTPTPTSGPALPPLQSPLPLPPGQSPAPRPGG